MIDEKYVHDMLAALGPSLLKPEWKRKWTKARPTTGYCYLVSEVLYHYVYPTSKSFVINLDKLGTHWYVVAEGLRYDWTYDQFDFRVPYEKARHCAFFKGSVKTERGFISKKGHLLAKYLKVI